MSEPKQKPKKISRRDAIKLLGAVTGATVLANLPSKWSTPEIAKGVLPVHAQTSSDLFILSCDLNVNLSTGAWSSTVFTGPNPFTGTRVVQFTLTFVNMYFAHDAPGPQSPNPVISNRNLDSNGQETIDDSQFNLDPEDLDDLVVDPNATSGSFTVLWEFLNPSHGSGTCSQTFNWALPTVDTISVVDQGNSFLMDFSGEVLNEGSSPVTARGFVWSTSANPTLANNFVIDGAGIGTFSETVNVSPLSGTIHVRAYATNSAGTAYGDNLSAVNVICLAEGMLVTLANGTEKKIEDVNYGDSLLVWNFDEGKFDEAPPLWIKRAETINEYNLIEFSDGSFIKTVHDHRIFNKEKGMFTYPMISEDAPIGTTTFNVKGEEVILVNKSIVQEQVNYYNVITDKHMNLFTNGILTSCRYNNIYPIVDMKFVKDDCALISQAEYNLEEKYYEGLRLAEQIIPVEDTIAYVNRLKAHELETEELAVA